MKEERTAMHMSGEVTENVRAAQVALVVKNPSANAGDIRDAGPFTFLVLIL